VEDAGVESTLKAQQSKFRSVHASPKNSKASYAPTLCLGAALRCWLKPHVFHTTAKMTRFRYRYVAAWELYDSTLRTSVHGQVDLTYLRNRHQEYLIDPHPPRKMTNLSEPSPNSTSTIEGRLTSPQDRNIIDLSARQREEILLTNPDLGPFTADIPVFVVLIKEGEPIACGGLRLVDEEEPESVAEIKRVYVVPEARGQANGVSDFLLMQLELHAAKMGWNTLRLQTNENMLAANRWYKRHGYVVIPNYGEYVDSSTEISYEKVLA